MRRGAPSRSLIGLAALTALTALTAAGCGSASTRPKAQRSSPVTPGGTTIAHPAPARPSAPAPPAYPHLLASAHSSQPTPFVPVATWRGRTAAWIARSSSGVTLISFDQSLVEVHLHSGTIDAGTLGWRYGPAVGGVERRKLVAAFNGAFRLSTGAGGFESYGRIAAALRPGLGSIVTYSDGSTDIGSWGQEVPARGKRAVSIRQNLGELIDGGVPASNLGCLTCWGATLGGVVDPARSALGITADGRLVWAAGEHLTVAALAQALQAARVARAVELDINPEWVAGYLYDHQAGPGPPTPVPALADQRGIPGELLAPWSRDFFTVTAR